LTNTLPYQDDMRVQDARRRFYIMVCDGADD